MTFIKVLETILHTETLYEETPEHLQVQLAQKGEAPAKSESTSANTSKSKPGISLNTKQRTFS